VGYVPPSKGREFRVSFLVSISKSLKPAESVLKSDYTDESMYSQGYENAVNPVLVVSVPVF